MTYENQEPPIAQLTLQATQARTRLADDIEALAYKVSPENLKREAKEVSQKALRRWSARTLVVAIDHPFVVTTAMVATGLLYAAVQRRRSSLFFASLACGAGAWLLGRQTSSSSTSPRKLTAMNGRATLVLEAEPQARVFPRGAVEPSDSIESSAARR